MAMLFEVEHGKMDDVDFLYTLQQELVLSRRNIVSLTADLVNAVRARTSFHLDVNLLELHLRGPS